MPPREFSRAGTWLLPPTVGELVPADHPARYVAAFVDGLDRAALGEVGVAPDGAARGAPAYHPRVLLGVWLYGSMRGTRSSRKLEQACRDQVPYRWLTGWQRPDHTALWRFYREHRRATRRLLTRTVRVAVAAGLVDLAVQAVDGTRIAGSAARERSLPWMGWRGCWSGPRSRSRTWRRKTPGATRRRRRGCRRGWRRWRRCGSRSRGRWRG